MDKDDFKFQKDENINVHNNSKILEDNMEEYFLNHGWEELF